MKNSNTVEVSSDQVEPQALRALIEEYISRDGTFYGDKETSMDQKVDMVISQLESGEAGITWNIGLHSGDIVLKKDINKQQKEENFMPKYIYIGLPPSKLVLCGSEARDFA